MRIVVTGLVIMFLTACGGSQTEQVSNNQRLITQDETQVVMEKPDSTEMSTDDMAANNNVASEDSAAAEGIEDLKLEQAGSDALAETTSDNAMINDVGIQAEVSISDEEKPMEAMEGDDKEIAKQKESEEKMLSEPRS